MAASPWAAAACSSSGIAALQARCTPITSTPNMPLQASSLLPCTNALALQTRMSSPPICAAAWPTQAFSASPSAMSTTAP